MKAHSFHMLIYASVYTCLLSALPMVRAQSSEDSESEIIQSPGSAGVESRQNDLKRVAKLIVDDTNTFRKEHELPAVKTNSDLQDAAHYFAEYMAKTDEYGHKADGNRPAERAEEHGYEYCIVLENIAYLYSSRGFGDKELARKFERGWEQSPGHRKNMLDADVTETGVAVRQSQETGHFYAVQMFGRPKSAQIHFQISNQASTDVTYELGGKQLTLSPRYTRTHYRCRPTELQIHLKEEHSESLTPKSDDKIVIIEQDGSLIVNRK